jgi:hypothetical protein
MRALLVMALAGLVRPAAARATTLVARDGATLVARDGAMPAPPELESDEATMLDGHEPPLHLAHTDGLHAQWDWKWPWEAQQAAPQKEPEHPQQQQAPQEFTAAQKQEFEQEKDFDFEMTDEQDKEEYKGQEDEMARTEVVARGEVALHPEKVELHPKLGTPMAWIPKYKVGVCACAKCGTTALYNGLYRGLLHKNPFMPGHKWGDIQRIHDQHWGGVWARRGGPVDFFEHGKSNKTAHDGYAIAFVREPVSRLVSAWKDKFSCGLFVPRNEEGKGDGGWFEAAPEDRRKYNVHELLKVLGGGHSYKKTSHRCPSTSPTHNHRDYESPNTNTTFDRTCTYEHCFSLEQFADLLIKVHSMGLQDELNAHVKPQSRVCFKDGATPDKWDKVTTGYDQNAIRELGKHLHADISLNEDQKDGQTHSTADALLDGEKFKVPKAAIHKLMRVTHEEVEMLHPYYSHHGAKLMGDDFEKSLDEDASASFKEASASYTDQWRALPSHDD